ncbi:hypothetical protein [Acidiphilium sp. PM]|uniref:hypothetical protein n=1 Tax=Acidiphilium sp. PM TaxID=1043206 RepID=UPI0002144F46|nr:hypothetical protein [Acidiphilium sp. PM]EGO94257.1 Hypothetical protein APM_2906 [Acidiphilium sp. PM]
MPWFTPAFTPAPPPAPAPEIIYKTEIPVAPHEKLVQSRVTPAVVAYQQVPAVIPAHAVPAALRKTVYLSYHRQKDVAAALAMIARQTGYTFINDTPGSNVVIPRNAGVAWISGVPDGAPAIADLLAIGRVVGHAMTVQVDPNNMKITLIKNGEAE